MSRSPDPPEDAPRTPLRTPRRSRARMSVVPQGDTPPAPAAASADVPDLIPGTIPGTIPDMIPAVLPDPAVARLAVRSSATIAERLADLSMGALADSQALARRWASETTERLALLARPPERPEDVMHALSGFMAAQGDLATAQIARAMALAQRVQVETMGLVAEAGQAFAQETADALHRAARPGAARD